MAGVEEEAPQGSAPPVKYRSLFENAVEGIYRTLPEGRYLAVNAALARIYGYESPAELIAGISDIARSLYVEPADRSRFVALFRKDDVVRDFVARVWRKDGSVIWISENAWAVRDEAGRVVCYEGTVEDITDRKRAEEQQRLAAAVFEGAGEAIIVVAADGCVRAVNPAFERMTGWPTERVLGQPFDLFADEMHDIQAEGIWAADASGAPWNGDLWAKRAGGDVFPVAATVTWLKSGDGLLESYVVQLRDISRAKAAEQRIRFHANHDSLTRLVNRHTAMEYLADAVQQAAAEKHQVAVLFLDLNRFKDINDTLGHAAGDELLRQVAQRLRSSVRAADITSRLGGDEFAVILPALHGAASLQTCIDKVLYAFSHAFAIAGREVYVSASVGIALYPTDADDADTLLSCADMAMYHAKTGGGGWRFYDEEMNRQIADRVNLEMDMHQALNAGRFHLVYQPQVEARSGRIVGAEALIRWNDAKRGAIPPALFIPIAERIGLIGAIGEWTVTEACRQIRQWRGAGLTVPRVSVNLSPAQFRDANLKDKVRAALAHHALETAAIELEITETSMTADIAEAIAIVAELDSLGLHFALDDFGTGYSSLATLARFPIRRLKIDRAFVAELPHNQRDGAVVASIIALAANLGFQVVAEGVETVAQARELAARGCAVMQGYLFSHPVPAADFAALLADHLPPLPAPPGQPGHAAKPDAEALSGD